VCFTATPKRRGRPSKGGKKGKNMGDDDYDGSDMSSFLPPPPPQAQQSLSYMDPRQDPIWKASYTAAKEQVALAWGTLGLPMPPEESQLHEAAVAAADQALLTVKPQYATALQLQGTNAAPTAAPTYAQPSQPVTKVSTWTLEQVERWVAIELVDDNDIVDHIFQPRLSYPISYYHSCDFL
jgi:hypothetical protein